MHLRIASDANAESGVGQVVDEISGPIRKYFVPRDYGETLLGIAIVLMCRNPELNFVRRLRFARKEKTIFMDVMLDLEQMRHANHQHRKRIIVGQLIVEVPLVLKKYSVAGFDEVRFLEDMNNWLTNMG